MKTLSACIFALASLVVLLSALAAADDAFAWPDPELVRTVCVDVCRDPISSPSNADACADACGTAKEAFIFFIKMHRGPVTTPACRRAARHARKSVQPGPASRLMGGELYGREIMNRCP